MGSFPASLSSFCLDINQNLNCACPDPLDFLLCLKILYLLSSFIHISNMGPDCFLGPNFKTLVVLSFCFTCRSSLQLYSLLFLVLFIQVLIKWSPSLKKRERDKQEEQTETIQRITTMSQLLSYTSLLRQKRHIEKFKDGGSCLSLWPYLKDKVLGEIQFIQIIKTLLCKSTVWEHTMEIKKYLLYSVGYKSF